MSRPPPDTLSKEDIREIASVRRDLWVDGFYGMIGGSVAGLALHTLASRNRKFGLNRNTALAWFLGGGALGSFILATTKGKNEVHRLHPIFQRGANSPADAVSTSEELERIQKQIDEELEGRERNRLFRRRTLQNSFEKESGGLSDSHGGHWVKEDGGSQE